ncbi:hypothetical protein ACFLVN_01130 [Chloroflexota bacterium]
MPEKWQEALTRWKEWVDSVDKARSAVGQRYGSLSQLVAHSKTETLEKHDSQNGAFTIKLNKEAQILWDIDDELGETARKFVSCNIGLDPHSLLHFIFVEHWMNQCYNPIYSFSREVRIR